MASTPWGALQLPRGVGYGLTCAVATVAMACGTAAPTGHGEASELTLAMVEDGGNNQRAMTGATLDKPLRVVVTQGGRPAAGIEIEWRTGYGSIVANGPTNAQGIASASWTLPTNLLGLRRAQASLPGRPASAVTFAADPSHPRLEILAGAKQEGVVGEPLETDLVVRVTWDGHPLTGRAVSWTGPDGEVSDAVSDVEGLVRAKSRLGQRAGEQAITLRLVPHGVDGPEADFAITARPGPAAALTWVPWVNASDGTAPVWIRGRTSGSRSDFDFGARLTDAFGNGIPDAPVAWSFSSAAGITDGPSVVTTDHDGVSGTHFPRVSALAAADFTATATLPGLPTSSTLVTVVDFLQVDAPTPVRWSTATVTVRAGDTVRWASMRGEDHGFSFVTIAPNNAIEVIGPLGSLHANPGKILAHTFHTPGTFKVVCTQLGHVEELLTIQVTP